MPRPMVVATAAPVTPISGKGPSPKIRQGSNTMFTRLASHTDHMAMAASPAPRKIAFIRNSRKMVTLVASITVV